MKNAELFFDVLNVILWLAGIVSIITAPGLTALFWAFPAGWTIGEVLARRTNSNKPKGN